MTAPPAIAVTGMGCISAAGANLAEHEQTLDGRPTACAPIPDWLFASQLTFPVFMARQDPLGPMARRILATNCLGLNGDNVHRTLLLALEAVVQALDQAGLALSDLTDKRVGFCLGTTVGSGFDALPYYAAWRQGKRPDLAPVLAYFHANISSTVQALLGLKGPVAVVTNACASGTDAIGLAKGWLETDRCDLVLAGGADGMSRIACNGFSSLMLTDPEPCRPYDVSRKGLNLGEGAGILCLEKEDEARGRGASLYGYVRGYGAGSDAYHPTAPHPQGRGMVIAITRALAAAGKTSHDISFINGHGTGTSANDMAETMALAEVFGQRLVPLISTKPLTGHTLGAAGGLEAIFTLSALSQGRVKGSGRCVDIDPALAYQPLPGREEVGLAGPVGISQSLAFGGGNGCLILEAAHG